MITWWRGLDNDVKQVVFVVGLVLAGLYLMAIGLWVATGYPAAFIAVAVISGVAFILAGLMRLAAHLFPTEEDTR
ncbi:hypothetical protein GCM10010399_63920 [Dactylosporangium fulvum]|uniref:Uncharacterized protein n=1 Tax=Dactylosporangium fulvum TaxID=53359 RepID=A0ABY5W8V0_9ACTN|nr:hypothetical protein [Dactylosporangium fulvum]UWP85785.1 hypothetical protein Dfulv_16695 [Dactylosporangium fulvum]